MASVATYLNFDGKTEEAFNFYQSIFGGEFEPGGMQRMSEAPQEEGTPPLSEADKNLVMNVGLKILGGHVIMGTDASESMGFKLVQGNHIYIMLCPDTRSDADRLFKALSEGGKVEMPMQEMFWGDYYGSFTDKFGIGWMIDTSAKE